MTRAWLVLAIAGCSAPASPKLPGGSITPHLDGSPAVAACGVDVAYDGDAAPDIRYRYAYDDLGRVAHATGAYAVGADDSIDYTWDHLDHMMHMVQTRGWGDASVAITSAYDTLGDLLDYTWHETATGYDEAEQYTYSSFTDIGQPSREVIAETGQPTAGFDLDYDALGRIAHAVQDGGPTTTYTYDDSETRTITVATSDDSYFGTIVYDDQSRELWESWGSVDPSAIATDTHYDWNGDQLAGETYRQGTTAAPKVLAPVEVDTLVYGCADARATKLPRSRRVTR